MALSTRHPTPTEKLLTDKDTRKMKKQILALAASSTTVLGIMATGVIGSTTAFAGGANNVCTNYQSIKLVECVGQVNGNTIKVEINALNENELNILSGDTLVVLAKDIDVIEATTGDVNVIAVNVSNVLNGLTITACNIEVLSGSQQANGSCHS
jgi:hypothetical protein